MSFSSLTLIMGDGLRVPANNLRGQVCWNGCDHSFVDRRRGLTSSLCDPSCSNPKSPRRARVGLRYANPTCPDLNQHQSVGRMLLGDERLKLSDPVNRLILLLKSDEVLPSTLQKKVGLKHCQTFRGNYLHPALENGLLERTIPEKPTSRLQKYRLTEKGRKVLERLMNDG